MKCSDLSIRLVNCVIEHKINVSINNIALYWEGFLIISFTKRNPKKTAKPTAAKLDLPNNVKTFWSVSLLNKYSVTNQPNKERENREKYWLRVDLKFFRKTNKVSTIKTIKHA